MILFDSSEDGAGWIAMRLTNNGGHAFYISWFIEELIFLPCLLVIAAFYYDLWSTSNSCHPRTAHYCIIIYKQDMNQIANKELEPFLQFKQIKMCYLSQNKSILNLVFQHTLVFGKTIGTISLLIGITFH